MPVFVYVSAAAIVLSLPLLWWALSAPNPSTTARTLIGPAVSDLASIPGRRARTSWLRDRSDALTGRVSTLASAPELEGRIGQAGLGSKWTVERVILIKVGLALAALLGGGAWAISTTFRYSWALVALASVVAFGLPDTRIGAIARERQRLIELQLPDLLDKLTISIEAGLGFDSALARVVSSGRGAVYDEFRWVLQDLQLGLPREAALESLAHRSTVRDLRMFVAAVNQSGKYGLPLGTVMRNEAADLRDKRRSRAEERAQKVPVKILMPLIFCVLPSLFIVVLGPGLIRISRSGLFD